MWYYYLILATFIFLSYRYDYLHRKLFRSFSFYGMLVVLIAVAGFRFRMGVDSIYYEYEFVHEIPPLGDLTAKTFSDSRYQPLYLLFISFCRTLSNEFMVVQLLHATIVNTIIFWFFRRFCKHTFLALALYFLLLYLPFNMEVMRESMAVAMFLCAWPFFKNGKWIWYYVFCIASVMCHISAVITFILPILWLPGIRSLFYFGKRTIYLCVLLLIVSFGLYKVFFEVIQMLALSDSMTERAETYSNNELGGSMLNIKGMLGYLIKFALYPLMALYFIHKSKVVRHLKTKEEKTNLRKEEYMSMWCVYVSLITLAITIFHRYCNYFAPFSFLLVADWAYTPLKLARHNYRFRYYMWVLIFTPLFFVHIWSLYSALNPSGSLRQYMVYAPYKSRLNPEMDKKREEVYRFYNHWW